MKLKTSTVLRLAKTAVKSYAQSTTQPGFVTEQDGQKIRVTFKELYHELSILESQDIVAVHRCKDCDNFAAAPRAKTGSCFPKSHSCGKKPTDYCSCDFTPRSEEKRKVDEAVTKLLSKERA